MKHIKYKLESVEPDREEIMQDLNNKKRTGWICLSVFNDPAEFISIRDRIHILYYKYVTKSRRKAK